MSARHLYVHVPFCARRCSYCDFSIAVRRRVPVQAYLDALGVEARLAGAPPAPATIYLGGGTPSRLGGDGIAALARLVGAGPHVEEFTLEANPEDVTADAVRAWVHAGVDRLSLGAQSFDDRVLRWMHRTHDAETITRAVAIARAAGIGNLSLDLIFALPDALGRRFDADLARAIALEPDHVSLYGLTVEAATPLARWMARGITQVPGDDRWAEEYLLAHERLGGAGYRFYEVSNAARPGREARHNSAYWRLVPYLGLGPSAHSFDRSTRWWNTAAYAAWQRRLAAGERPVAGHEVVGEPQRALERLYLSLRTADGIRLDDPAARRLLAVAPAWVAAGWASAELTDGGRLTLTPQGWLRLDELVASV